jgi:hypothetical protein
VQIIPAGAESFLYPSAVSQFIRIVSRGIASSARLLSSSAKYVMIENLQEPVTGIAQQFYSFYSGADECVSESDR